MLSTALFTSAQNKERERKGTRLLLCSNVIVPLKRKRDATSFFSAMSVEFMEMLGERRRGKEEQEDKNTKREKKKKERKITSTCV